MRRRVAALAVAFVLGASACNEKNPSGAGGVKPVTLVSLDQIKKRLADDKASGKVAVMHMWATWCGPCVEEFPMLARFYAERLALDPKIDFFAVSVDDPGDRDAVMRFVVRSKASFPVFIADAPDQGSFSQGLDPDWPSVLPTTFLYGADGRRRDVTLGEVEDLDAFKERIDSVK